eukprot:TRINITY_DN878_c0_g1_i3.p1 TRINITY_DN878_c0_g1~~TRINITY_DN878_c0_g1_i3.p1  ORF type:complete len:106 (-),score=18.50 TRINITY_DN878_c0_g1_i3:203-520(-)
MSVYISLSDDNAIYLTMELTTDGNSKLIGIIVGSAHLVAVLFIVIGVVYYNCTRKPQGVGYNISTLDINSHSKDEEDCKEMTVELESSSDREFILELKNQRGIGE